MNPPDTRFHLPRCLVAAASGYLFTHLYFTSTEAWAAIATQNWDAAGLGWLKADFWAQLNPWKRSLSGAALTLVLALAGEFLRARSWLPVRVVRWGSRVFGRPLGFAVLLILALLPHGISRLTRPAAPAESAPNVLFVMVDTWRADHTSFLGYERETWPEIGRLAEESGVVFERAVSQAPWTKPSVGTMFTSLVPSRHGAISHMPVDSGRRWVSLPNQHYTLAEYFAAAGYETFGVSVNPNVCEETGFAQGFRRFYFPYGRINIAEDVLASAQEMLDEQDGSRPFFCYVHITDPHYTYDAPAPFRRRWDTSTEDTVVIDHEVIKNFHLRKFDFTDEQMQRLVNAYDEELLYTDSQLGPFIRQVRERWPNTVVVLVGDHGDELKEHDRIGHGHVLFDELTHVPMLMWAPGVGPRRVPGQVRMLDVLPTLLDLSGRPLAADAAAMGQSLVPYLRGEATGDLPAAMETGGDEEPPWHLSGIAMRHDGRFWKLIRTVAPGQPEADTFMLFDLEADPAEQVNLAAKHPEVVEALSAFVKEKGLYTRPEELAGSVENIHVPAGVAAGLRELGYVGDEEETPRK